jgi:hypothetical protein
VIFVLLNLLVLIAAIAVAIALPVYGYPALLWGFQNRPKTTAAILVAFVAVVLIAALSFHHFFPRCGYSPGLLARGIRCS